MRAGRLEITVMNCDMPPRKLKIHMFSLWISHNAMSQCTVGDDVQASQMAISGQKPSFAHLLVAHAPLSNFHMSDLDFWLDSTPFWCRNHFCTFKTEEVTNIFRQKIFFLTQCSAKVSSTVQCVGRKTAFIFTASFFALSFTVIQINLRLIRPGPAWRCHFYRSWYGNLFHFVHYLLFMQYV